MILPKTQEQDALGKGLRYVPRGNGSLGPEGIFPPSFSPVLLTQNTWKLLPKVPWVTGSGMGLEEQQKVLEASGESRIVPSSFSCSSAGAPGLAGLLSPGSRLLCRQPDPPPPTPCWGPAFHQNPSASCCFWK